MRDFDEWLSKFRASISSYDYYIDFEKVVKNVEEIKVELNILNTLIGSKNIEEDFEKIMTKYPKHYSASRYFLQYEDMKYMHRMKMVHFCITSRR